MYIDLSAPADTSGRRGSEVGGDTVSFSLIDICDIGTELVDCEWGIVETCCRISVGGLAVSFIAGLGRLIEVVGGLLGKVPGPAEISCRRCRGKVICSCLTWPLSDMFLVEMTTIPTSSLIKAS